MTYTHKVILMILKKEGNPVICYNMEEPGGYYAKGNKTDTEWQILCHTTYRRHLKYLNS